MCEQLLALTRVLPGWASLVLVAQARGDPIEYLRVDRNMPFPDVKRKLVECSQSDRAPMTM